MVRDRDDVRLVLDDQHRVALVAQLHEQPVHPLDVVRWSPTVGSSNTYEMSVRLDPRWRIIFVRWASPPDNVPEERSSDR